MKFYNQFRLHRHIIYLFVFLFSCVENDNIDLTQEVKKIVEINGMTFEKIEENEIKGFRVKNLNELDEFLSLKSGEASLEIAKRLYENNGILLDEKAFLVEEIAGKYISDDVDKTRILCLHNPGSVYQRLNTGNPLVGYDVSFGWNGSGLVQNFNGTLGGVTLGVTLGKNTFNQDTYPNSSQTNISGIIIFTLRYNIFVEGIGTVYTTEAVRYRVLVTCYGQVSFSQIVE